MSATMGLDRAVAPAGTGALPKAPAESETTLLDDPGEQHDCTTWEPRADARPIGRSQLVLGGRSARVVVTMGMPALVYRWYLRAHSVKSLERNILGFVGIAPIHRNLVGMIEGMTDVQRERWLETLRGLGERGE